MAQTNDDFYARLQKLLDWRLPANWPCITCIDAHTEGEPLRVIIDGFPKPEGKTILARRRWLREQYDHLRAALMWEPRGHADMYGCVLTPPISSQAEFGIIFLHNEGYSTMCGHGIIAATSVVLQTGLLPMREPETTVQIDTPAGLVTATAHVAGGRVQRVAFRNVPAYVVALDETVNVPGIGTVRYDLAFGGAYYAYVQAADVKLECTPAHFRRLIETGMAIKRAVMAQRSIEHPFNADLGFLYGTILIAPPQNPGSHSRNVCIFAEGEVDRSPTGTGVSGRLALHYARGEIRTNEKIVIESILGTTFAGRVLEEVRYGPYSAVIPEIEGTAHITGVHTFGLDPADPLRHGFLLR